MGDIESQLTISCHQARLPAAELSCFKMSCWPRRSRENPQTSQDVAKLKGCSLKTDGVAPLLRTTPTEHAINIK